MGEFIQSKMVPKMLWTIFMPRIIFVDLISPCHEKGLGYVESGFCVCTMFCHPNIILCLFRSAFQLLYLQKNKYFTKTMHGISYS